MYRIMCSQISYINHGLLHMAIAKKYSATLLIDRRKWSVVHFSNCLPYRMSPRAWELHVCSDEKWGKIGLWGVHEGCRRIGERCAVDSSNWKNNLGPFKISALWCAVDRTLFKLCIFSDWAEQIVWRIFEFKRVHEKSLVQQRWRVVYFLIYCYQPDNSKCPQARRAFSNSVFL